MLCTNGIYWLLPPPSNNENKSTLADIFAAEISFSIGLYYQVNNANTKSGKLNLLSPSVT